jgi:predicted nucleic acid-binding protein
MCPGLLNHFKPHQNLLETRKNLTRSQLEKVNQLMNQHVTGAVVTNYKALIPLISLLDENDRHVVAAAIQTRAEAIVTFNLKDFPDHALSSYSLKAIHPDDFIADLMDLNTSCVLEAVRKHRAGLKNPPFTAEDYLDCLLKQRLPETVSRLSQFKLLF